MAPSAVPHNASRPWRSKGRRTTAKARRQREGGDQAGPDRLGGQVALSRPRTGA